MCCNLFECGIATKGYLKFKSTFNRKGEKKKEYHLQPNEMETRKASTCFK